MDLPRPAIPLRVTGPRRTVAPKKKPIKPFDPAKRRFQSDGLLTEKSTKLIKRLKKSKKHKKRARDSSDSDSDSS
jgi:hypothetical protein